MSYGEYINRNNNNAMFTYAEMGVTLTNVTHYVLILLFKYNVLHYKVASNNYVMDITS